MNNDQLAATGMLVSMAILLILTALCFFGYQWAIIGLAIYAAVVMVVAIFYVVCQLVLIILRGGWG